MIYCHGSFTQLTYLHFIFISFDPLMPYSPHFIHLHGLTILYLTHLHLVIRPMTYKYSIWSHSVIYPFTTNTLLTRSFLYNSLTVIITHSLYFFAFHQIPNHLISLTYHNYPHSLSIQYSFYSSCYTYPSNWTWVANSLMNLLHI